MTSPLPLVAITMGDPVGVGPEIIPRALGDPRVAAACRPVVYGDARRLQAGARAGGIGLTIREIAAIGEMHPDDPALTVINPAPMETGGMAWGRPDAACGRAMAAYLNAAIDDALARRVSAIATAPINKAALRMAGIPFDGHTEILARRTATADYAMMLAGDRLRVVLATIHLPIRRVPGAISTPGIAGVIALTDHALKHRFGLSAPRIAVAGLNPHAGESGLFGDEEQTIIAPAIARTASRGIRVTGPHPPDTVFHRAAEGAYDAVVAMYHDQGLGPFKMIHFADGVNTTLGLPIVRTSVDHGTAYDIAGTGTASAASMAAAILMAAGQAACLARRPA